MIDRNSRDKLALTLRRYAAKRITNDELESAVGNTKDRGVLAVRDMAWRLYSDMCCHRAEGQYALDKDVRRKLARWILFLRTDCEYAWPDYKLRQAESRLDQLMMDLFTAGRFSKRKQQRWQEFLEAGEFEVWPFLHQRDEESVRLRRA
jgi:hypothetical protein